MNFNSASKNSDQGMTINEDLLQFQQTDRPVGGIFKGSLKREILRKSLHLPGLFFLFLGRQYHFTSAGILFFLFVLYFMTVLLSKRGYRVPLVSALIDFLKRDGGVDLGPPCLALGLMLTLLLFDFTAAACGIIQVCVADGAAAVAGKYWGERKIFYSQDKTYVGTFVFFVVAFIVQIFLIPPKPALILALAGSLFESLPFGAFDNFLIPMGSALFFRFLMK